MVFHSREYISFITSIIAEPTPQLFDVLPRRKYPDIVLPIHAAVQYLMKFNKWNAINI